MRHPDEVVDPMYRDKLQAVAQTIDELINPVLGKKEHGFIVAFFQLGDTGRFNYMSNCRREDIAVLMREMAKRFEGAAEPPVGRA